MIESDHEYHIEEMPEKDVLEDYLISNHYLEPTGVVFDYRVGLFKRTMPKERWQILREEYKKEREDYVTKIRKQMEGQIFLDD